MTSTPGAVTPGPVLKYVGGKTKLLPELLRRLPPSWGCYHEPFVGGGALFFALESANRLRGGAAISDLNEDVINIYRALVASPRAVARALRGLQRKHRKDPVGTFQIVRDERNRMAREPRPGLSRSIAWAAHALYLNRTCFNGLWRVNRAGDFNVPLGRYDHATLDLVREGALEAAGRALCGISIDCCGYLHSFTDVRSGDLVYADPPYAPLSKTSSFVGYASGGFGETQQRELAIAMIKLAACGVHVMISNSDTALTREIYDHPDLIVDSVECARAINSKGGKRGKVGELIVTSRHSRG